MKTLRGELWLEYVNLRTIRNREFDSHFNSLIILLPSTLAPHFNVVSVVKDANLIMALPCFESITSKGMSVSLFILIILYKSVIFQFQMTESSLKILSGWKNPWI